MLIFFPMPCFSALSRKVFTMFCFSFLVLLCFAFDVTWGICHKMENITHERKGATDNRELQENKKKAEIRTSYWRSNIRRHWMDGRKEGRMDVWLDGSIGWKHWMRGWISWESNNSWWYHRTLKERNGTFVSLDQEDHAHMCTFPYTSIGGSV